MVTDLAVQFSITNRGLNSISSLEVARVFGREHKNVLRQIDSLQVSGKLLSSQSEPSEYKDSTGRTLPMFLLTESGFSVVVASFNFTLPQDPTEEEKTNFEFQKEMQKYIINLFNKFIIDVFVENKKLRQRNAALESSEKKALLSEHPRRKTPKYGYILVENGTEYPDRKRVLLEDANEVQLKYGEIDFLKSIIYGNEKKITALYEEIRTLTGN